MGIIQNDTCDKILSVTLPFYNHNIIPVASNTMDNKIKWIINKEKNVVNFHLVIESVWLNAAHYIYIFILYIYSSSTHNKEG